MVNSWSLLYDEMYGPDDEANLKAWKEEQLKQGKPMTDDATGITEYPPEYMYDPSSGSYAPEPFSKDPLADNDDQIAHHVEGGMGYDTLNLNIEANSPYNDGWTRQAAQEELDKMAASSDGRYKYHEDEILADIKEYVSSTYNGHYTGTKHEFRNVQTIDLMASRDLAPSFCQSNILKYGSRYGSKDGRNKKDLMKVIHYAMLLLHFDEHYGKPSQTSGEIDHTMP